LETDTERIRTRTQGCTVQMTLTGEVATSVCVCGKVCKNVRGLRIHQARSKSCSAGNHIRRTEFSSGKTVEVASQDQTHSTSNVFVDDAQQDRSSMAQESLGTQQNATDPQHKDRVLWPKGYEKAVWKKFDEDLEVILNSVLQGPAERRISTLTTMVYNIGKERFGTQQKKGSSQPPRENRREREIKNARKELNSLKRRFRKAPETERIGLQQLREDLRGKLKRLRKAERLRTGRKSRAKKRSQFVKDPFKFTRTLLSDECSGRMESTQEEIQQHLHRTHSDPDRDVPLGNCPRVDEAPLPSVPFDMHAGAILEGSQGGCPQG